MSAVSQKFSWRERRTLIVIVVLNIAIIAAIIVGVAGWFFSEDWTYYTVGDYDLDQGRFIKIVGEKSSLARSWNLRYEVMTGNKVIVSREVPGSHFYTSPSGGHAKAARDFTIVPAQQGDLVAITDRTRDDDIVILHDFRTNQSWPAQTNGNSDSRAVGRALLWQLQREYPFFSSSALSAYCPRWVWSPRLTHWLMTYPETTSANDAKDSPRLLVRAFETRRQLSLLVQTECSSEDFDREAALGWMGNDKIVLALDPQSIFAWKLNDKEGLTAAPLAVDDAVRARAKELLASPRPVQQFVIPTPLLTLPEQERQPAQQAFPEPPRARENAPVRATD